MIKFDIAVGLLEEHLHTVLAARTVEKVGRVRLVGADDLVRTRAVHINAPLRDIEVVSAPVAVVPGSDIVVKAPEHRIELVDAARSELIGIRTPLGRTKPHIPIAIGIGRAFGCGIFRLVEEAHGMARTAKLLAADTEVGVDVLHIANAAVAYNHARHPELGELRPATLHGANLKDAVILLLRFNDLLGFFDAEGERLFAVDILAMLHRLNAHVGVPVVRGSDADHVDRRIFENVAEVGDRLAVIIAVGFVDLLGTGCGANLIAVANGNDFNHLANLGGSSARTLPEELRNESCAHLDSVANHSDATLLARLELTKPNLGRGTACKRGSRS